MSIAVRNKHQIKKKDTDMKKLISSTSLIGTLTLLSRTANAAITPNVPEIDGSMAALTIGLTVGVVALIREHRRKK